MWRCSGAQKYSLEIRRGWRMLVFLKSYVGSGEIRSIQDETLISCITLQAVFFLLGAEA